MKANGRSGSSRRENDARRLRVGPEAKHVKITVAIRVQILSPLLIFTVQRYPLFALPLSNIFYLLLIMHAQLEQSLRLRPKVHHGRRSQVIATAIMR